MNDAPSRVSRAPVLGHGPGPGRRRSPLAAFLIWGNSRSWVFDRDRTTGGVDACASHRAQAERARPSPHLRAQPRPRDRDWRGGSAPKSRADGRTPTVETRDVDVSERSRCTYVALVPGESARARWGADRRRPARRPRRHRRRYADRARLGHGRRHQQGRQPPTITKLPGVGVQAQVAHWSDPMRSISVLAMDQRVLVGIDSIESARRRSPTPPAWRSGPPRHSPTPANRSSPQPTRALAPGAHRQPPTTVTKAAGQTPRTARRRRRPMPGPACAAAAPAASQARAMTSSRAPPRAGEIGLHRSGRVHEPGDAVHPATKRPRQHRTPGVGSAGVVGQHRCGPHADAVLARRIDPTASFGALVRYSSNDPGWSSAARCPLAAGDRQGQGEPVGTESFEASGADQRGTVGLPTIEGGFHTPRPVSDHNILIVGADSLRLDGSKLTMPFVDRHCAIHE